MTHPDLIETHHPLARLHAAPPAEQFDLELDEYGYAELEDVVQALTNGWARPSIPRDVKVASRAATACATRSRPAAIRALYGHSIDVKPGEPSKPPERLYVGVSRHDAERALRFGLRPGRRSYLHLALSADEALETAQRTESDSTVLAIHASTPGRRGSTSPTAAPSSFRSHPTQYLEFEDAGAASARPRVEHEGWASAPREEHGARASFTEPRSDAAPASGERSAARRADSSASANAVAAAGAVAGAGTWPRGSSRARRRRPA
jgi:putative RNA 2'-phosphotransferase